MEKKLALIFIICAVLILVLNLLNCSYLPLRSGYSTEMRELDRQSFDLIWNTINDKHYDPEFGGLDWQGVYNELEPRLKIAKSHSQARDIMWDMITRLELSHFNIIPAEVSSEIELDHDAENKTGIVGLDVRVIDGQALVTDVFAGYPAHQAGVKQGWEILKINHKETSEKIAGITKEFAGKSVQRYVLASVFKSKLSGVPGHSVNVHFLDENEKTVEKTLTFVPEKGEKHKFGYMPPFLVKVKVDTLENNIGYFSFNAFIDPLTIMTAFNNAIKSFMNLNGVIIDVRGNGGGMGEIGLGIAGWFINEKGVKFGTVYFRDNHINLVTNPRAKIFDGPVVILTDGLSASAAELFSGGMQDCGRACIVGTPTAGAALPSTIVKCPNGDVFQYAFANYISASGKRLEGKGVIPDIKVNHTRDALLRGRDNAEIAAIKWIRQQNKPEKTVTN